jgi:leucine dehydrogenase
MVDDPDRPRTPELLHALGRGIHELGGRYLAAEDVGATMRDMDLIAEVTPWVTGVDPARGGSGDPSPVTAVGVVAAMRAALAAAGTGRELRGRRVAVQGVGHVGAHLVALLVAEGASVVLADVNDSRARAVGERHGADVVSVDEIVRSECDVLAPCALGATLTRDVVGELRCRIVCGAANNQLGDAEADARLQEAGVVYVPDFVANAGGIINIAEEFTGYSRERALERTRAIEATVTLVLEHARDRDVPTEHAAVDLARARLATEGAGQRWEPGDPAAWTDGAPLVSLRP